MPNKSLSSGYKVKRKPITRWIVLSGNWGQSQNYFNAQMGEFFFLPCFRSRRKKPMYNSQTTPFQKISNQLKIMVNISIITTLGSRELSFLFHDSLQQNRNRQQFCLCKVFCDISYKYLTFLSFPPSSVMILLAFLSCFLCSSLRTK